MAKILVTGGRGLLGRELVDRFHHHPPADSSIERLSYTTFRTPADAGAAGEPIALDLRDRDTVAASFDAWEPNIVVHTAAPRGAGTLPEIEQTTAHVAEAAAKLGARLIHLSSDMVFDGEAAPYAEDAAPAPVSPYGEAKLAAERAVEAAGGESLIVRTSVIYGFDPLDHQTSWVVAALESGEPVTLFTDEYRSPVWVGDLAAAVAELAVGDEVGVLHVAGASRMSRWEFGERVLRHLDLDPGDTVRPGTLAESGLKRPPDLTLDLRRSERILGRVPRGVDEVLEALAVPALKG